MQQLSSARNKNSSCGSRHHSIDSPASQHSLHYLNDFIIAKISMEVETYKHACVHPGLIWKYH